MTPQIAIILVSPENPDNIGAVARAMKNMGLSDLVLVQPPAYWKRKGRKMAMSAKDVLQSAQVFKSLPAAVRKTHLVVGTTRRQGPWRGQFLDFEKGIQKIQHISQDQPVAVLFGKESKGLDNESLALCDFVLSIPSDDLYPSLNLAQAVMVIAFSLFKGRATPKKASSKARATSLLVSKQEIQEVLAHFEKALVALDYDKGNRLIERILTVMHGIFKRNGMQQSESQMLKGLSRTIVEKLKNSDKLHHSWTSKV